jgi:hypothetical protein
MSRNSNVTCEASKQAPVQTKVESQCPKHPFRVCNSCAHRLRKLSLRPLEWFNLAAAHTFCEYYLHDDFYDDDGTAHQPQEEVVSPEAFPAPTLAEAQNNPETLLDYAFSRWYLKEDIIQPIRSQKKSILVESLRQRVSASSDPNIEARAYEICAVLGKSAASWVRQRCQACSPETPSTLFDAITECLPISEAASWIRQSWKAYHPETLSVLIEATAKCLRISEGFPLAVEALEKVSGKDLPEIAWALSYFHSARTLDWIEEHVSRPCMDWWGRLAADSCLSWTRVCDWLGRGRLLSLVALDALNACWHYDTPLLKRNRPKLLQAKSKTDMTRVLEQYALTDPVPRVQRAVQAAVSHWDEICGNSEKNSA